MRAVRDFALENNFLLSVAYHSSRSGCVSEKVISPWLWEDEKGAPDLELISELGIQIAESIPSEDGLGYYYPGNSISMRGNAHDWFYKETGCIQYLIEVGSSNIQPDNVDLIESTISHNMQGLMHLLKRGAGSNVQNGPDVNQVSGIVTNIFGDPIFAKVELVELSGPMLTDRYTDSFGRFRRLLGQDSYSLIVSAFGYETYSGTVSSSSNSVTEISIILNELPKYNINLDFTNSVAANYNIEVRSSDKVDYLVVDTEVLNLEYPSGNYEIIITSDLSYPKLLSFNLSENIDFDLSINCNCLLLKEEFDNLNNWNISSNDFIIDDSKLSSQNGKVYSSNLDSYLKSTIDLSALNEFSSNMVLEINLKNELEWQNDQLSFILESEDGLSYTSIIEISGHDFEFHKIIVPIEVQENNTYLKMIFKTDGTVNYRGFSIKDIKVFFELDGQKGDLDFSDDINVLDVIALIDLLFDSNSNHVGCRTDLNSDSIINIFDIVTLVEIILNN